MGATECISRQFSVSLLVFVEGKAPKCFYRRVFEATPFSFHQHASDATYVIPSIITYLEEFSAKPVESRLCLQQRNQCHLALFEGHYGTYHGELV